MHHRRGLAALICVWLLCVAASAGLLARGQAQERESLLDRFQSRSNTGASFVGAYVADIFETEERLASVITADGWRSEDFVPSLQLLGFPVGVLLDRQGRAVELAPAAPEIRGTELASKYPHLGGALAGSPTVSDVVLSAVASEPIVAFALPVESERIGVLSGGFSLSNSPLKTFLDRQPIPGTRGWVLDSHGVVIVSAGPESQSTPPPDLLAQSRQQPTLAEGRVVAVASIPSTGWTYVLDAPSRELFAPVSTNDAGEWTFLAVLAAMSLAGLFVVSGATAGRRRARFEKARTDHRLRLTVQNAPIGMTMVDLEHRFVEPNARLCHMLGYSAEELVTMTFDEVTHADDLDRDLGFVGRLIAGEIDNYELDKRYVRRDGSVMWGRLSVSMVRDEQHAPLYSVSQIEDITEFRSAQAELEFRALYDPLTGLANRSLLMDRLTHALISSSRGPAHVAVSFCDIDHFKAINDTHGHHTGDQVLKEVARRLRHAVRTSDTVARIGGDEFIILFTGDGSLSDLELVMDRAHHALRDPIEVDGTIIVLSMSGGMAMSQVGTTPDTLLRNADMALYTAKKGGRGRTMVHDHSPHGSNHWTPGAAALSPI